MKKIIKTTTILILIIFIKVITSFVLNETIIKKYNKGDYNNTLIKPLYILNIIEPYIVYYNEGNILYQNLDYENAIKKYEKALKNNPPEKRICDIRVNLSLSKIKNIITTNSTEKIKQLDEAQQILYENNCATKIGRNGKSKEAENLDDEIEKLKEQEKNDKNDEKDNDKNDEKNDENKNDKDIEEQLKEIQHNSNETRQENMNKYENLDNYEYYSGKRW